MTAWSVLVESVPDLLPIGGIDSGTDAADRLQTAAEEAHPEMGPVAGAGMDGSLSLRMATHGDLFVAAAGSAGVFRAIMHRAFGDTIDSRFHRLTIERGLDNGDGGR